MKKITTLILGLLLATIPLKAASSSSGLTYNESSMAVKQRQLEITEWLLTGITRQNGNMSRVVTTLTAGTPSLSFTNSDNYLNLSADSVLSFSDVPTGSSTNLTVWLYVTSDGTKALTFPASITWQTDTATPLVGLTTYRFLWLKGTVYGWQDNIPVATGTSVFVNDSSVSNPNLASSATLLIDTQGTNVAAYPTNLSNAQISASAGIEATKLGDGTVDSAELSKLNGVTTNLPTTLSEVASQLGAKAAKSFLNGTNTSLAPIVPYDSFATGAGNFGPSSGETSFEFLNIGNLYRIRQKGEAVRVKIYLASKTGLSSLVIKVWRFNGSTYDLVNQSSDILGSINPADTNAITVSIPSIQVGDYVGCRVTYTAASVPNFVSHLATGVTVYSVVNSTPTSIAFSWPAQTATAGYGVPIELDSYSPSLVAIGDSIMAGHPNNYSFVETTDAFQVGASIPHKVAEGLGLTYQNVAIGGQTMTNIAARFEQDVMPLNPKWVLLQGGVNDIDLGETEASFTNSLNFCITNSLELGARVVYVAILPWSNGNTANHVTRAQFNADAKTIVEYHGGYYVDAGEYVGQYRSGNAAGNIDDIQPVYNADGVHFTPLGYARIAAGILEKLNGQIFEAVIASSLRSGSSVMQDGLIKTEKLLLGTNVLVQGGIAASKFGIGTTNSGSSLTVKGGTAGNQNFLTLQNDTGTPTFYFYYDSAHKAVLDLLDNAGAMKSRLRANGADDAFSLTGGISASGPIKADTLVASNGITAGSGTNGYVYLADTNGAHVVSIKASTAMTGNLNFVLPASGSTELLRTEYDGNTNVYLTPAVPETQYVTPSGAGTLANKTLTTPTISSFVNANHTHQNSAGGGTLNASAIGSGTIATARLGSGTANSTTYLAGDQTYKSLATVQQTLTNYFEFALGDETTALTTGTKVTWRAPFAFIVKGVRASVTTASSSGNPEFDIKENGVSIFSTTLTIDASEKTSTTAATAAVVSDTAIADDAEITFPVITAGTGTTGPKVKLYYVKP